MTSSTWIVPPGWALRYQATTGSTNDDAKAAARAGCPSPTVFLADVQTSGRGRLNRAWVAPPDSCLLFSLLLREPASAVDLTALCSVAIAETISAETGLPARIKWPNDVMIGERKLCGILTEVIHAGSDTASIIGIGLNVNLDLAFPGLPPTATSLAAELGRPYQREPLLSEVLSRIDRGLGEGAGGPVTVRQRWEALLWRRRQLVRLADGVAVIEGVVEGLAPSGALRLRTIEGELRELQTGELLLD